MHYYETRESNSRQEFTNAVKEIQDSMALFLKGREAQLAEEFKAKVQEMQKELVEKEAAVERRKNFLENEYRGIVDNFEREKARWKQQHQGEYDTYMQRAKEREDWAMASVTAREKRLTVLEEQYTADRGKWERETEERVLKKEEALRSQYETTIEEMRRSFEQERQKLSDTYLDQLQRITNLHAQNERELERMHREKERELGQPYKTSFVQSSTTPTEKEREQSFLQQSSLLSKFEMVEAKQNERAQKLKMAFGEKDSGSP
ncbi:hypothetical protein AGDE_08092 [Angomonas deanei]|uniref:Uncharacterized protein n=1 Tax=Angomonas deanei TaxID=59799 RepID=A0A7G2CNX2_9TRYP|nr:hypothetical protein AGDE_08092 [Angomonas deanei]CAD2221059.1 hypothetical protein, conserved [Angomonas deanei]|eukprot:EPY34000.1 hypothetical protein AGDE_08092 [Angomonas deanei]